MIDFCFSSVLAEIPVSALCIFGVVNIECTWVTQLTGTGSACQGDHVSGPPRAFILAASF